MNRMQLEARILGGVCSIGKPPWNGPRLPFRRCMYSCLKLESTIENVRREKLRTKSKTQGPNGGLNSTQSRKGGSLEKKKKKYFMQNQQQNIPAEFARANRLQAETSIVLRVRSGKSWPVKLSSRKISASSLKRSSMTKGWDEFYASNKLKEGDVCHFELRPRPRARRSNTTIVLDVRRIPADFVKSNDLARWSSITLRDSLGKLWPVTLKSRPGGPRNCTCLVMSHGWNEFYAFNNLKKGDVCKFELSGATSKTNSIVMDMASENLYTDGD
ncbi:hypothetical protein RJ639_027613 [Escallonia herrerae]|uniref:TF-B3 domain-containing protein n=1 Tax=Escallonia herrerae TaxID=1293975 RepID=A0AA88X684_9ASTE|nr:hypothetical protein RJ639_027613 [Escallonia herrerae]